MITVAILATTLLLSWVNYEMFKGRVMDDLEAYGRMFAVEMNGEAETQSALHSLEEDIRVTLVHADGTVYYDNFADPNAMDNHADRPEIRQALENGSGSDIRNSSTVDQSAFYYAVRLKNGDVMRLAQEASNIWSVYFRSMPLIMLLAAEKNVAILPVDSEHSAIFQSLQGNVHGDVEKILLTASGGPFRGKDTAFLENVQVEDALKHPNWSMGRKITIDSATMVNKGLEVIEAKWLFDVKPENIQVVVQPQSIIHSMVEFKDGAVMAQLGSPDMRLPIQYALYYPERRELNTERLDFYELANITFEKPDMETFKGLKLAYEAAARGGNIPTALNAANEVAVARFLDRKIKYLDIPDIIEYAMNEVDYINNPTVEQILSTQKIVTDMIESRW